MNKIKEQLEQAGYAYAVAIATEAERKAQAACGSSLMRRSGMRPLRTPSSTVSK